MMKIGKNITYVIGILAAMLTQSLSAQVVEKADTSMLADSRPVIYKINSTILSKSDSIWIADTLRPAFEALEEGQVIFGRATASPEGPYPWNKHLAEGRMKAAAKVLTKMGFDVSRIQFDIIPEDYVMLLCLMRRHGDPSYEVTAKFIEKYADRPARLEQELRHFDNGRLWRRIFKTYFPQLRAVRFLGLPEPKAKPIPRPEIPQLPGQPIDYPLTFIPIPLSPVSPLVPEPIETIEEDHRIPFLSVRTNLLYDLFYMPNYGFAPMWNGSVEYYPVKGHFTYGASFINPYWHKWSKHKFFQIRNYELEARYYFRPTTNAYYRGFYVGVALDYNKYGIGFSKTKGWQGIGYGAQATIGYVTSISHDHAWKLHFTLGFGFYQTYYDPYVYGKPIWFGGEEDGLYYYETHNYRPDFKARQHVFRWFGPTQVGISISYDLLWRRGTDMKNSSYVGPKKGVSFRHHEEKK